MVKPYVKAFFFIAWHFLFRRSFLPRKESVDRRSSQCHPGLAPPKRELFLRLPKGAEAPQCHLQQLSFELLAPQRTNHLEVRNPWRNYLWIERDPQWRQGRSREILRNLMCRSKPTADRLCLESIQDNATTPTRPFGRCY